MSWNLVDYKDESYSPKHHQFLHQIHDFINSTNVIQLSKLMVSGYVDFPEGINFNQKYIQTEDNTLKIILG